MDDAPDFRQEFLQLAFDCGCLRFGDFTLKSGRRSPYFFNAGAFSGGDALARVGECQARAILAAGVEFDLLFGPAYKGIPLATACAVGLRRVAGRDVPVAFDRKEAKAHGDAGRTFGAPLAGRALIVDDVISAGTAARGAAELLASSGAAAAGLAILFDRGERGAGQRSAVQEVEERHGMPVVAVARARDFRAFLERAPEFAEHRARVEAYLREYGA